MLFGAFPKKNWFSGSRDKCHKVPTIIITCKYSIKKEQEPVMYVSVEGIYS